MTVAKTFALAIEEAANRHPASEPFIVHAALLAPEPIPLFLFAEAREKFDEPLTSALSVDGLDETVATLRTFALIDGETTVAARGDLAGSESFYERALRIREKALGPKHPDTAIYPGIRRSASEAG
jgi:Tetratricopeptide repeat